MTIYFAFIVISACFLFIFNIMKYSDLSNPITITVLLNESQFIILFKNTVNKYSGDYEGDGLESKKEIIRMLNNDFDTELNYDLVWSIEDNKFVTKIILGKDYLEGKEK